MKMIRYRLTNLSSLAQYYYSVDRIDDMISHHRIGMTTYSVDDANISK